MTDGAAEVYGEVKSESGSVEERDWAASELLDLRRVWEVPLWMRWFGCWCCCGVVRREGEPELLAGRLSVSLTVLLSVEHRLPLFPRREHRASLRL